MEREHFVQSAARALGLSSEAVRESLKRLPKQPFFENEVTNQALPKDVSRSPREIRSEQLLATIRAYPGTLLAERLKSEYCRITEAQELPPTILPEATLFHAEQTFGENPGEKAADELLHAFEEAVIREAYQTAIADLRRAEAAEDAVLVSSAQALCAKLSARLATFGN